MEIGIENRITHNCYLGALDLRCGKIIVERIVAKDIREMGCFGFDNK